MINYPTHGQVARAEWGDGISKMIDYTSPPTGFQSCVSVTNAGKRAIIVGYDILIPPGETRPLPWCYTPNGAELFSIEFRFAD